MQSKWMIRVVAFALTTGALIGSLAHAREAGRDRTRAGFDDLSRDMSTCAAYYSLLSSIVENSKGDTAQVGVAKRIKSTGNAMLTQSINVANYIGIGDDVVMERVQSALKEMIATANGDPPNSLSVMHDKYGRPCDELLQSAPRRFAELVEQDGEDF
jgi:hypothetical protein